MGRTLSTLMLCGLMATTVSGQVGDAQRSIRNVDFRNFTYTGGCIGEEQKFTTTDGVFERADPDDSVYFQVLKVVYGDLTGDGVDEAIVQSNCNTGGTGQFSDGTVFTMRGGKPVVMTTLGIGDRADGGIYGLAISDGVLVVERFGQDNSGACCPEYVETQRFRFNGKKFVPASKATRRAYNSVSCSEGDGPLRVKFLRGTSSATLSGSTNTNEKYVLGVRGGQTLDVSFTSKDANAKVKIITASGTRLMTLGATEKWSGQIPESGDLTIAIESTTGADSVDAYFDMDVTVR